MREATASSATRASAAPNNTRCITCGSLLLGVPRACTKWTRDEFPWRSIV
jgi:hypothetical protein